MSAILDPLLLDGMESTIVSTMRDRYTIVRQGQGRSEGGSVSDEWTDVVGAIDLPCRVAPSARLPRETEVQATTEMEAVWIITTQKVSGPTDPAVFTAADRIRVTITRTNIVMLFEVVSVVPARSNELVRRCVLKLVV